MSSIVFPNLPLCALPKNLPDNVSTDELIAYVRKNSNEVVDSWTYAVRFRGENGRLAMHEDNDSDVTYREMEVTRAIRNILLRK